MSFRFLTDPEDAIAERFHVTKNNTTRCKVCGDVQYGFNIDHFRSGKCHAFDESVRLLRVADQEGIELCPLKNDAMAYK